MSEIAHHAQKSLSIGPAEDPSFQIVTLKKARGVVFSFRTYYAQLTPSDVILQVFRSVARPVLEYGAEVVLPNSYYSQQFERLQRFSVSFHLHKYNYDDGEYNSTLVSLNLAPLANRRAAAGICYLMKSIYGVVDVPLTCICFGDMLQTRRSARLDGSKDLVILRNNNQANSAPLPLTPRCERFKISFIYRTVSNYNMVRKLIDIDQFSAQNLRKLFSLLHVDDSGLVSF